MKPDGAASSSQWSIPEVLAQLRAKAGKGKPVAVQVFLHDDVSAENLAELAEKIVTAAKEEVGKHAAAKLGKVHRLAKSFSVSADVDTLSAVANMPNVKTILPSEISDILPRPVKTT
jgi:hypothetical protein